MFNFSEHYYAAQDGLKLYFREYGERSKHLPSLLFLGGINRNSKDNDEIAKLLSGDFHIISPDYRGRGRSAYDPVWQNYHPSTYLNDLRHLLALSNIHKVIALGTSMGGLLTMAMSAVMPATLVGAVINDVGPDVDKGGVKRIVDYIGDDTSYASWDEAIAHIQNAWNDPSIKTAEDWRKNAEETFTQDENGRIRIDWDPAIAKALKEDDGSKHDLWPLYRGLGSRPTLIIRGGVSDILAQETLDRMGSTLPNTTSLIVPDTGHTPRFDSSLVAEALSSFLRSFRT